MRRMDMNITVDLAHGTLTDEDADDGFPMKHWWIGNEVRCWDTMFWKMGVDRYWKRNKWQKVLIVYEATHNRGTRNI